MLIRYKCRDMGLNCFYEVKGETLEEVVKQAMEHVRANHADEFNAIRSPEEVQRMEEALARSTRVVVS